MEVKVVKKNKYQIDGFTKNIQRVWPSRYWKKLIIWSNNTKPRKFTIPKPHIHNHTSFGSHLNHIGIHISKLHIHNLSHP